MVPARSPLLCEDTNSPLYAFPGEDEATRSNELKHQYNGEEALEFLCRVTCGFCTSLADSPKTEEDSFNLDNALNLGIITLLGIIVLVSVKYLYSSWGGYREIQDVVKEDNKDPKLAKDPVAGGKVVKKERINKGLYLYSLDKSLKQDEKKEKVLIIEKSYLIEIWIVI
eukprot:snap_masked-scaffold_35-processed-gene-2.6-mRNA-1 protein AED:1.00 eAED:1.00 QI:0/0/0/0/1/1/2/0/168